MPTGIYGRSSWAVRPWWLVEWGLRQLGVFEKQAALGKLPTKRYVVVANVEVCSQMGGFGDLWLGG